MEEEVEGEGDIEMRTRMPTGGLRREDRLKDEGFKQDASQQPVKARTESDTTHEHGIPGTF